MEGGGIDMSFAKKKIKKGEYYQGMKKEKIKIQLHSVFDFAYLENLQNVAIAVVMSGYFVQVHKDNGNYILEVYTYAKT